ncbi:MAG: ABC transporter permease, partial [Vitreoscilla sp.]|nr:ABC transporter permease [Vitreoscilla sp.]
MQHVLIHMNAAWTVFRKELLDALRDRRTLTMVLLSSVAMGPLMLLLMSTLASDFEKRAEAREAVAVGMAHAPSLQNFLARQTWTVRDAPSNYEQQLESSQLGDPVLVLEDDFEAQLAAGEQPLVQIVTSSANQRASGAVGKLEHVLREFSREQVALRLMVRGVAPSVLQPLEVAQRDLANPAARAARLTGMLPFFVLMAVMYGALTAALDSTAGERERGSLEPLLMNPAARFAIVLGKWGAVASVGMMIA